MDAPAPALPETDLQETAVRFTHPQVLRVIFGVILCIFLAAMDQTVVIPAVPAIAADLNGFGHLSWIVSAYLLTSTASTPIYGKLSDIYGRRAMLLPAIAVFVAASVLCGACQTLWQLILARALQGLGGGGLMSMAQASIADVVSPRERGRYQGYMASAWGVASIAGPIIGGWMTDQLSWRWIFWINLPIGIVAFLLSERGLRILRTRRQARRIDYTGAALLTLFVAAALLALSWGGTAYAWTSPPMLGLLAAIVALLAALVWQERRASEPLLPPRLFANRVFVGGTLIAFAIAAGMFGATFLLPLYFQLVHGANAAASGTLIVPFLALNVVGAFSSGQLARRIGRVKPILFGSLSLCTLGFAVLTTLSETTRHAVSVAEMGLLGFGIGATMPTTLVMVQNAAERRDVGTATGGLLFLRSMGGAFGSTLVGTILTGTFLGHLARNGIATRIDLGALRGGSAAGLPHGAEAIARTGLVAGFSNAFLACAGLAVAAFVISFRTPDRALRDR